MDVMNFDGSCSPNPSGRMGFGWVVSIDNNSFSIYGNDEVCKTPTFDRIAKNGILFHHAYVSSPSCTPSRNAILTGQWHWRLGGGGNLWSVLDPKHRTYPHLLEDAGYFTGSWRKSWGPGNARNWKRYPAVKRFKSPVAFLNAWKDTDKPFCFWL